MTYNTGNALGSTDARDLYDNAQALDQAVNSTANTFTDRFGVTRNTVQGAINYAKQFNFLGGWAAGTAYAVKDLVTSGGVTYLVTTAHTSTTLAADRATGKVAVFSGSAQAVSVKDFGAALDGATNDATALFSANAAAVAAKVPLLISGTMHIGTATTITAPIVDTMNQLFSATSAVTINNGQPVRPDWWGIENQNIVRLAIDALPNSGGTIQLEDRIYKPNGYRYGFGGSGNAMTKDNVRIQGRKMPTLAQDCRSLTGGTIIQGQFSVYANNFEISDVGIDGGKTVLDTYFGGVSQPGITEALGVSYPNDASKAAGELRRRIRMHNVIGLASGPADPVHAIIVGEGVTDVVLTGDIVGMYGVHGVVFKCANVKADNVTAYCNNSEGVIFKSDIQPTAIATSIQVGRIKVKADGPDGFSPYAVANGTYGVLFHCAGNNVDQIQIGQILERGYPIGVGNLFDGAYVLSSINIAQIQTDAKGVAGTTRGLSLVAANTGQIVTRFHVGRLECRNRSTAFQPVCFTSASLLPNVSVDSLDASVCSTAVDIGNTAYVQIGKIATQVLTDAVYRITGTPKLEVGLLHQSLDSTATYSSTSGGLVPALSNAWTQIASNDVFGVDLTGGRVQLRGLIKPGSSNAFTTLPVWARPLTNKRTLAQGFNGSATVAVPVVISTDGICKVNEIGGDTANCSNWLSLCGISFDIQK